MAVAIDYHAARPAFQSVSEPSADYAPCGYQVQIARRAHISQFWRLCWRLYTWGAGPVCQCCGSALGTSRRRGHWWPVLPWVLPIAGSCRTPGDPHGRSRGAQRPHLPRPRTLHARRHPRAPPGQRRRRGTRAPRARPHPRNPAPRLRPNRQYSRTSNPRPACTRIKTTDGNTLTWRPGEVDVRCDQRHGFSFADRRGDDAPPSSSPRSTSGAARRSNPASRAQNIQFRAAPHPPCRPGLPTISAVI